ncbi:MAG: hypothetical protein ABEI74_00230 [Candidatus Pacearchaeota archaeon]
MGKILEHQEGSNKKTVSLGSNHIKESDLIPILKDIHSKTGYRVLGQYNGSSFEVSEYVFNGDSYQDKGKNNHKSNYDCGGQIISPGSMHTLDFFLEKMGEFNEIVLKSSESDLSRPEKKMIKNIEDCLNEFYANNKKEKNKEVSKNYGQLEKSETRQLEYSFKKKVSHV